MPSWSLPDLTGKTWTLKQFEGKSLLINVWATWCGPCLAELPHIQKLWDQLKDSPNSSLLTLNMDENPGLVAPFLAGHKYTFPVLLAYQWLTGEMGVNAIPQNWLVDSAGQWRFVDRGFGLEDDWPGQMVKRLQSLR